MTNEELTELENLGPAELVLEYENTVIDAAADLGRGHSLERIRELRRIIVRRLKLADQAAGALT